ncbi:MULTISPECIES: hypothetical protein [unclassified Pasteurella]|uniref:hypothetical protein n=1 Tax=unclassified Pasteurella TaxID=2621516 RepID=UPI0010745111|nr:hypothetical protein [Pasteurella sp. 19428wF3_WM03]TFU49954.1 hypothetical protein E4T92_09860 [Pasteurella sp. WM03]
MRTKKREEESALLHFERFCKQQNWTFQLNCQPETYPDALVTLNGRQTWIEVTTAYLDQGQAKYHSNPNRPSIREEVISLVGIEYQFYQRVFDAINKKLQKNTMKETAQTKGKGILIILFTTPFTSEENNLFVESYKDDYLKLLNHHPNIFEEIYLHNVFTKQILKLI